MNKFLSLLLVAAMLLSCVPAVSLQTNAADVVFSYTVESGVATITGVTSGTIAGDLVIPATVDGYPVVSIGDSAFAKQTGLTSVIIQKGIKEIGLSAFRGCSQLMSVVIEDYVTVIGYRAFYGCVALSEISIPETVEIIDESAFAGCNNLMNVYYGGKAEQWNEISIGERNERLLAAELHAAGIESIGVEKMPKKTSYLQGEALDTTGLVLSVLYSNGSREYVTAGYTVSGFDSSIAGDQTVTVTYGEYTTTFTVNVRGVLGSGHYGSNITWLLEETGELKISGTGDMPHNSSSPWAHNNHIKTVTIESGITSIGNSAFSGCENLTQITMPKTVVAIGKYAFSGCKSLTNISLNYVKTVDARAFYSCSNLKKVSIGMGMEVIDGSAFAYCGNLATINVSVYNPYLCVFDNALMSKDKTKLIRVLPGLTGSYTVPDTVTVIGDSAFSQCKQLTQITMGDNVTQIGVSAFQACERLTSIRLSNKLLSIGDNAFEFCGVLTEIEIPASVTAIGQHAFGYCYKLSSVVLPDSVTSIGDFAFLECTGLTQVTLPCNLQTIGMSVFSGCSGLTSVTIPEPIAFIGRQAFGFCTALRDITLQKNVTTIDAEAFRGSTALTDVYYTGTWEQWQEISIGEMNEPLQNATLHTQAKVVTGISVKRLPDQTVYLRYEKLNPAGLVLTVTYADGTTADITEGYTTRDFSAWEPGDIEITLDYRGFSTTFMISIVDEVSGICGQDQTWTINRAENYGYVLTISGTGTVDGTGSWKQYSNSISHLVLESGITAIEKDAFDPISCIDTVTIPASVTVIAESAFDQCEYLGRITFKGSNTQWESISIGENNAPLRDAMLHTNENPYAVSVEIKTLPEKLVYRSGESLNCTGLVLSVTWSNDTVTEETSGYEAWCYAYFYEGGEYEVEVLFDECSTSFMVTVIEPTSGSCGSGLTWTFNERTNVLTIFGTGAMRVTDFPPIVARNAKKVIIGHGVTKIAHDSFGYFWQLTEVTIPETVTVIDQLAFGSDDFLTSVYYTGTQAQWESIDIREDNECLLNATIYFETEAYPIGIEVKKLPNKVDYKVGETLDPTGLVLNVIWSDGKKIEATEGYSIQNPDFTESKEYTVTVYYNEFETTFSVVVYTEIGGSCGENLAWTLNDRGLLTISGNGSLTEAPWLTEKELIKRVVIEEGVTAIRCNAFENCVNLTEITVPASLTFIGENPFEGCNNLTTVCSASVEAWCAVEFEYSSSSPMAANEKEKVLLLGGNKITDLVIPSTVTKVSTAAFMNCTQLKNVSFYWTVTSIGDYAFQGCTNLENVYLSSNIQWIGGCAFEGCDKLQMNSYDNAYYLGNYSNPYMVLMQVKDRDITQCQIHENTRIIYLSAFSGCKKLTDIVIPDGVEIIADCAFMMCSSLATVQLPANLTYLGVEAFEECSSLAEIAIPEGLEVIDEITFLGCTKLSKITIPESVRKIAWGAFIDCGNLTDIYYGGKQSQWDEIVIEDYNECLQAAAVHTEKNDLDIVSQPQDVRVELGGTAIFTVQATGEGLTYQWQRSFEAEEWFDVYDPGYNTNTLRIENVEKDHNRDWYQCVITDASGNTVTSEIAILRVPYIMNQPRSSEVKEGAFVVFSVDYSMVSYGYTGVTYQWQYKQSASATTWEDAYMTGARTNIIYFSARAEQNGYVFRCVINDNGTEIISDEATLTVRIEAPTITSVTLRPEAAGLYFTGNFEITANMPVVRQGIVVSVYNSMPVADGSDPLSIWSEGTTSVLVKNILSDKEGYASNQSRAAMTIYARAYVELADGTYIYSTLAGMNLQRVAEVADTQWASLDATQKTAFIAMYEKFGAVMETWALPNLKNGDHI